MSVSIVNGHYRAYAKLSGKEVQDYFPLSPKGKRDADARQDELDAIVRLAISQRERRLFDPDGSMIGVKLKHAGGRSRADGVAGKAEVFFVIQKRLDGENFKKHVAITDDRPFSAAFASTLQYMYEILEYDRADIAGLHAEARTAKKFYMGQLA